MIIITLYLRLKGETQGTFDCPRRFTPLDPHPATPLNDHCMERRFVRICYANSSNLIGLILIMDYKNWCFLNLEFLKSQTRSAQTVRFLNEILQFENNTIFPPLSIWIRSLCHSEEATSRPLVLGLTEESQCIDISIIDPSVGPKRASLEDDRGVNFLP